MPWIPNSAALKWARERKALSVASLAERAKVVEKTVRRLESGKQRNVRPETLRAIATALGCEMSRLATLTSKPRSSSHVGPATRIPVNDLVEQGIMRRPTGSSAPRTTKESDTVEPERLTEESLEDIRTAFRAHQGRRFLATGRIQAQAPLSDLERTALGCARGIGARFTVVFDRGGAARATVHTRTAEATKALQFALKSAAPISMVMSVTVVEKSAEHRTWADTEGFDAGHFHQNWTGFTHEGDETSRWWALVIENSAVSPVERASRGARSRKSR